MSAANIKFKKGLLLVMLAAVFLTCGFFRDYVFLNVNEQVRVSYYHASDSVLAPGMKFLEKFSYPQLYYLKWALTFLFSFLFLGLTLAFVKLFFNEKRYLQWTFYAYAFLFITAGMFFLIGYLAGHSEKGYTVARFLMGMAQGPIVLMVLIPAIRLLKQHSGETL